MFAGTIIWVHESDPYFFYSNCDFENNSEGWNFNQDHLTENISHSPTKSFFVDSTLEFSATFSAKTKDIFNSSTDKILSSVDVFFEGKPINPNIVISVENGDSVLFWISSEFSKYRLIQNNWNKISFPVQLPEIEIKHENMVLKVYIWNLYKDNFFIDDFEIIVTPVIP